MAIDFITRLLLDKYLCTIVNTILVITDRYTKIIRYCLYYKIITIMKLLQFFIKEIFIENIC